MGIVPEEVEAENQSNSKLECVNQSIGDQGLVRTFLVFLDLPVHVEFRATNMPLLSTGTVIDFRLSLRNPKDPKRLRRIEGEYEILRKRLIYQTEKPSVRGLTQYLELSPIQPEKRM